MKIGYARVSTDDQELGLQITSLKKSGAEEIFMEKISAVKSRPELEKVFEKLRKGDTLVVWKLDRLARSLSQLISILERLKEKGINLISISDSINTNNAQSMLYTQIIGAFAQFEREILIERTKAGLEEAKRRGVKLGRRPGLSENAKLKAKAAAQLYQDKNIHVLQICQILNISRGSLYRYLQYSGIDIHRKYK